MEFRAVFLEGPQLGLNVVETFPLCWLFAGLFFCISFNIPAVAFWSWLQEAGTGLFQSYPVSPQFQNKHEILVSTATFVVVWVGICAFLAASEFSFNSKLEN